GLAAARAIHDLCAAYGVPVWCGGMLESGIGRAHNVALASLPNFSLPGDLSPSRRYWARDIVHPEWTMTPDGFVEVPVDRPGLGAGLSDARHHDDLDAPVLAAPCRRRIRGDGTRRPEAHHLEAIGIQLIGLRQMPNDGRRAGRRKLPVRRIPLLQAAPDGRVV